MVTMVIMMKLAAVKQWFWHTVYFTGILVWINEAEMLLDCNNYKFLLVNVSFIQRLSLTTKACDPSLFVSANLTSNKFKNRLVNVLPCKSCTWNCGRVEVCGRICRDSQSVSIFFSLTYNHMLSSLRAHVNFVLYAAEIHTHGCSFIKWTVVFQTW